MFVSPAVSRSGGGGGRRGVGGLKGSAVNLSDGNVVRRRRNRRREIRFLAARWIWTLFLVLPDNIILDVACTATSHQGTKSTRARVTRPHDAAAENTHVRSTKGLYVDSLVSRGIIAPPLRVCLGRPVTWSVGEAADGRFISQIESSSRRFRHENGTRKKRPWPDSRHRYNKIKRARATCGIYSNGRQMVSSR